MSYLIDTCALSELVRPTPDALVLRWFGEAPQDGLFLSALTLGEIRKGVEAITGGRRRDRIIAWLEHDLSAWFGDRVLPIDAAVADEWGRLPARAGRTVAAIDSLIAATALHHRLTVVTRNVGDFAFEGLETLNPWDL